MKVNFFLLIFIFTNICTFTDNSSNTATIKNLIKWVKDIRESKYSPSLFSKNRSQAREHNNNTFLYVSLVPPFVY